MLHRTMMTAILLLGAAGLLAEAADRSPAGKPAGKKEAPAASAPLSAQATLRGLDGKQVGTATLTETPEGVLVVASFTGLKPGEHAFHIHEVGKCEPPFKTAGGHFNPAGRSHGLMSGTGGHAGDMPNVHVPPSGQLKVEVLVHGVTLKPGAPNSLADPDGAALVLHEGPDDYRTDPAGNAGGRIACGVVSSTL